MGSCSGSRLGLAHGLAVMEAYITGRWRRWNNKKWLRWMSLDSSRGDLIGWRWSMVVVLGHCTTEQKKSGSEERGSTMGSGTVGGSDGKIGSVEAGFRSGRQLRRRLRGTRRLDDGGDSTSARHGWTRRGGGSEEGSRRLKEVDGVARLR